MFAGSDIDGKLGKLMGSDRNDGNHIVVESVCGQQSGVHGRSMRWVVRGRDDDVIATAPLDESSQRILGACAVRGTVEPVISYAMKSERLEEKRMRGWGVDASG